MTPDQFPSQNESVIPTTIACEATTARGARCRNKPKSGATVCGAHGGSAGQPTITPTSSHATGQTYGEAVCALIGIGMKPWAAARRIRLAPATVESWIERGESDLEAGKSSEFVEFVVSLEMARVTLETNALETIQRAIKSGSDKLGDPALALKVLERIRPEDWSLTHKVDHSVDVNLVEQHADQLLGPLIVILEELGVADDPRVPDLIEQHFSKLEK